MVAKTRPDGLDRGKEALLLASEHVPVGAPQDQELALHRRVLARSREPIIHRVTYAAWVVPARGTKGILTPICHHLPHVAVLRGILGPPHLHREQFLRCTPPDPVAGAWHAAKTSSETRLRTSASRLLLQET